MLNLVARSKLWWGLAAIFLIGVLTSPVSSKGNNIFLSYGNLLDVLRQVSTTGLIATGMTAVILTAGIDLSVGSIMALCSVVCAMLLTVPGCTPPPPWVSPALALTAFVVLAALTRFVFRSAAAGGTVTGRRHETPLGTTRGILLPVIAGLAAAALVLWFTLPQVATKFGVLGVLLVAPAVGLLFGAIDGIVIVGGRLQPFIVTLAMMVTALGVARLTAGQNNAVLPVYTGSNAVAGFDVLPQPRLRHRPRPRPLLPRRRPPLRRGPALHLLRPLRLRHRQQRGGGAALRHREADGTWTIEALGGAGKAEGNVVEIWGGMGTQPAHDRHDGFHEITDKEPGIKYLLKGCRIRRTSRGSSTCPK